MRITTRLKIISAVMLVALVVLVPVLIWSFGEFKSAKNDYILADAIKMNFFERAAFRDQYFLYREDRAREMWVKNKKASDQMLSLAEDQFHKEEDRQAIQHLRTQIDDSAVIFQRIVGNTEMLKTAAGNRPVYEELDKRLFSQLLLKAATIRDMSTSLQDSSARRVELTYKHLTIIIGLFAVTLALATTLTATHLSRLIRQRLAPLHDGAKTVAGGNLGYRIKVGGTDEFSELALSINAMTDRLNEEIDAHKQMEEMLRKLSTAVEQGPASVVITDPEALIQYVNPRFTEVTGYSAAEAIGQNPRILKSGQTPKEVYLELWDKLSGGQPWRGELANKRKNGELYWEETHIAPVKNPAGIVTHYVAVKTDITERKQAEIALLNSETRYRSLIENSPMCIHEIDMDGRLTSMNRAGLSMLGLADECRVHGLLYLDAVCDADRGRIGELLAKAYEGETSHFEFKASGSREQIYQSCFVPVRDSEGHVTKLMGITEDITERKQFDEILKASEQRYHLMFDDNPMPMWVSEEGSLKFLMVNERAVEHYGYTRDEFSRMTLLDIRPAEDIPEASLAIANSPDGKYSGEWRHKKKDGTIIHVAINTAPMQFGDTPARIVLIQDITERKQAEQALKKENEKNLALLRNASDGIHILDTEGNVIEASDSFCSMLGYPRDEVIGMNVSRWDAQFSDAERIQLIRQQLAQQRRSIFETLHRRKDGSIFDVEVSGSPLELDGKPALFNSSRDITERKRTDEKLRSSEERLQAILNASEVAIAWANEAGTIEYVNPKFISMFGYTLDDVPTVEQWYLHAYPDVGYRSKAVAEWNNKVARSLADKNPIEHMEVTVSCKNGSVRHAILMGSWAGNKLLANFSDITERKTAEEKLQMNEARLRAILDNVPYLIWLKGTDGRFVAVNKAFFRTTGLARIQDVLGKTDLDLWPEELAKKYRADDAEVISTRRQKLIEEMSMANGEVHWVETFKAPITDKDGNLLGTTGFAQDITVRKNAEGKIRHLAHYDPLTDLPNRTLFSDRLQQALATAKRDKAHIALMFIDLDKFKPINDTLGHHVGDLLLKEAAKRMQNCVRESDTVARIGGDEFVVLLPIIDVERDALLVAEKIREALNQPFVLIGQSLNISSSTGIAIYPEHGKDETQLVKNADIAMYHAKEGGRNNVMIYQPDIRNDA